MARNIPRQRAAVGPFIIVDAEGQPVLSEFGKVREFSTISRATKHVRPGDKVVPGTR